MKFLFEPENRYFVFSVILLILSFFILPVIFRNPKVFEFSSHLKNLTDISKQSASLNPARVTPSPYTAFQLDRNKDYKVVIETSWGNIVMDVLENSAPRNAAHFLSVLDLYSNSSIFVEKDYLIKFQINDKTYKHTVEDEINADALGLNNKKVKDASFLSKIYDPNNATTKYFDRQTLQRYEDFSLKEFYASVVGYKYDSTLSTPKAVKYVVFKANKGPNANEADFFIVMSSLAPEIDGRYTPIGRVIAGFDVLDKLNDNYQGIVTGFSVSRVYIQ